ncbi:MAG TPA: sulfur transferase domain-containing protein [Leptolyngbyaceae cyanobacterium]|jgi:uncharacterized protein (TIGR01244 family)
MQPIRKINNQLTIAPQLTLEQLKQIAQEDFKSVLNLRSPDETGFLSSEQQEAESLGLFYINIPVNLEAINNDVITEVLKQINQLPKPILVHCDSAIRAAALVLIYIDTQQGATLEQACNKAKQLGLF